MLVLRNAGAYSLLVTMSFLRIILIFILGLLQHDTRHYFFANSATILGYFLTLPFIILLPVKGASNVYVPYFLCIFLIVPNLRELMRIQRYWNPLRFNLYTEKVVVLAAYIVTLLFMGMCTFNFVETRFQNFLADSADKEKFIGLSLVDTVYFIVITFTTVGYGDITPKTPAGKLIILGLIFLALALLPNLVADLSDALKSQAIGNGSYTPYSSRPFVIIAGAFSETNRVMEMIKSLIRRDVRGVPTQIVLLGRKEIKPDLQYAIKNVNEILTNNSVILRTESHF